MTQKELNELLPGLREPVEVLAPYSTRGADGAVLTQAGAIGGAGGAGGAIGIWHPIWGKKVSHRISGSHLVTAW